jgi:hypothetical protein
MTDRTIHKYPLTITDRQQVLMPPGAQILTAQFQNDQLCLWALVEHERPTEKRAIRIAGTGHLISTETLRYIATVQSIQGPTKGLVLHVFEENTEKT